MDNQGSGRSVGRPRQPLLVGQKRYVLFAYTNKLKTQLDIAAHINVSLPRVHRFLVEHGLHNPPVHGAAAHTNAVRNAVRLYIDGISIAKIKAETGVAISDLYKALHSAGIPLRSCRRRSK